MARCQHDYQAQLTCIVCNADCLHEPTLPASLALPYCQVAWQPTFTNSPEAQANPPNQHVRSKLSVAMTLTRQGTVCMQVAAVDKPKVHLWETGITRITRHPQNTGQLIWCLGHLLWIGNSFMLTTSAALVAHHVFACYHGDFRLERKHGKVSATSVLLACWLLCTHTLLVLAYVILCH